MGPVGDFLELRVCQQIHLPNLLPGNLRNSKKKERGTCYPPYKPPNPESRMKYGFFGYGKLGPIWGCFFQPGKPDGLLEVGNPRNADFRARKIF